MKVEWSHGSINCVAGLSVGREEHDPFIGPWPECCGSMVMW
jgi:hypothetical protein